MQKLRELKIWWGKNWPGIIFFGFLFFFIGMLILAIWEQSGHNPIEPLTINHVERVMMHQENYYTLFYRQDSNNPQLQTQQIGGEIKIFTDVPLSQPLWVKVHQYKLNDGSVQSDFSEIHLHQAAEINGGGWNQGKYGQGQTIPLE